MNFLFVNPKVAARGQYYDFPLGLAYVSAYMKHSGFATYCLNLCHDDSPIERQLLNAITSNNINVVCTGGMSVNFNAIKEVVQAARKVSPDIKIVVGGAVVTADPALAAELLQFDYGVVGEGEITMAELAGVLTGNGDASQVAGLIYRDGQGNSRVPVIERLDRYITTGQRQPIMDLDSLPFPDCAGLGYVEYLKTFAPNCSNNMFTINDAPRAAFVIASRSCPFDCTFCYHPLGRKYRQRSLDSVMAEIDHMKRKYDINVLVLMDELFSTSIERLLLFCKRVKDYPLQWMVQLRVSDVTEEVLRAMKESGVYAVSYGVESMSDDILKSMNKKTTSTQIEKALSMTRSLGIGVFANLIFGDPEETDLTVKKSLDWWFAHIEYGVTLYMIRVVPDSPIYRYALESGIIKDKAKFMKDGFPIINISKLSPSAFTRLCHLIDWYTFAKIPGQPGQVMQSSVIGWDTFNRRIYSVDILCPQCNARTTYTNLAQMDYFGFRGYLQVFCRNCHHRVNVSPKQVFGENYKLRNNSIFRFIAVNSIDMLFRSRIIFTILNIIRLQFFDIRRLHRLFRKLAVSRPAET